MSEHKTVSLSGGPLNGTTVDLRVGVNLLHVHWKGGQFWVYAETTDVDDFGITVFQYEDLIQFL